VSFGAWIARLDLLIPRSMLSRTLLRPSCLLLPLVVQQSRSAHTAAANSLLSTVWAIVSPAGRPLAGGSSRTLKAPLGTWAPGSARTGPQPLPGCRLGRRG